MTRYSIKTLHGEKVIDFKLYGQKSSHVKGWRDSGWIRSPGNLDGGLDTSRLWQIQLEVRLASHIKNHTT